MAGKTLAIKDNVAVAGVKCMNGNEAVDWTPEVDATVVKRILDAGGVITGKAACENNCFGAVRWVVTFSFCLLHVVGKERKAN